MSWPAMMTSAYRASQVPPGVRRAGGGDDDRAGVRRGSGDERAVRVEIEPPADHRDRRRRRSALPEVTPQLLRPGRLVLLLADRGRADQDDVAQRAEQREDPPVGSGGNALREAVQRRGTVRGRDHVGPQPVTVRVGIEPGQIRFPVGIELAQAHMDHGVETLAFRLEMERRFTSRNVGGGRYVFVCRGTDCSPHPPRRPYCGPTAATPGTYGTWPWSNTRTGARAGRALPDTAAMPPAHRSQGGARVADSRLADGPAAGAAGLRSGDGRILRPGSRARRPGWRKAGRNEGFRVVAVRSGMSGG